MVSAHERHAFASAIHFIATSLALPLSEKWDVYSIQLHSAVGYITAISHAWQSYRLHSTEIQKPWRPRWAEYAVTAPLMSAASYAAAGGRSGFAVFILMTAQSLVQTFGIQIEKQEVPIARSLLFGRMLDLVSTSFIVYEVLDNDNESYDVAAAFIYAFSFATFPVLASIGYVKDLEADRLDMLYVFLSVTSNVTMLSVAVFLETGVNCMQMLLLGVPTAIVFVVLFYESFAKLKV